MNIQLEEFKPVEQQSVKDFILEVWKEYGFYYIQKYDSDLDDPQRYYIDSGGMFYTLKDDGKIIGTIGVINKGNDVAELKRFYVKKSLRGRGYGSLLFDKALNFCKQQGFKIVEFETDKTLTQGHAYYRKRGFEIVREDKKSFYMEKSL